MSLRIVLLISRIGRIRIILLLFAIVGRAVIIAVWIAIGVIIRTTHATTGEYAEKEINSDKQKNEPSKTRRLGALLSLLLLLLLLALLPLLLLPLLLILPLEFAENIFPTLALIVIASIRVPVGILSVGVFPITVRGLRTAGLVLGRIFDLLICHIDFVHFPRSNRIIRMQVRMIFFC